MKHRGVISGGLAALALLPGLIAPALANSDVDLFAQLAIVAPAEKGKLQSTPAGVRFIHEDGWYVASLPPGTTTSTRATARDFTLNSGGQSSLCTAIAFPNSINALYTFSNLQKRADTLLAVGGQWDKAAGGMMVVSDRSVLTIGGVSIRAAAFAGPNTVGPGYRTLAVLETTKGTLLIGCTASTLAASKALTARTFRLATGAMAGQ